MPGIKLNKNQYFKIVLKHDLIAGLSVFLVALPLCLGIALASGAPIYSGLLSGLIGGIIVSLISGSQLGVSGPAAGLSTLVAASIISLGDYRVFLVAVIIAGVFQLLLGLLKFGALANYFPSSVIKGMLAAIGIILMSQQVPILIGYDQPDFWTNTFRNLFISEGFENYFQGFSKHISKSVVIISLCSMAVLIVFKLMAGSSKVIPISLIIVLAGVSTNLVFKTFFPNFSLNSSQMVNIPENIFANMAWPDFNQALLKIGVWKAGITIGILATLETLLSVEAIDKLDKHNRITPINRELLAQGIGNITCGFLGAIPITAVIVRGSANIDAGGRTKVSAFFHGVLLLFSILLIPGLLREIPYAALAVILVITGYNLSKPKLYKSMWALGPKQFLPFIITILVILSTDLLIGVGIGLVIAAYFIIQNNFKAEYKLSVNNSLGIDNYYIKLNTNVTFLNKVKLRKTLDQVLPYSALTIDGSECNFIDHDILEVISEFNNKARDRNISLELKGIKTVEITSAH